jgi:cardiolipin synthase
MNLSALPNIITTLRLLAVPPVAWLLLHAHYQEALWLTVIAGLSDLLDGFLAKRFGWTSRFGSIADPLADKLLMLVSFACMAWQGLLPWWLWFLTLLRDLVIVSGGAAYHYLVEPLTAEPSYAGKVNTTLQIILLIAILVNAGFSPVSEVVLSYVFAAVATLTVYTLAEYVWTWGFRAHERWPR